MRRGGALPDDWYPEPLPANVEVGDRSWIYSSFAFVHSRSRRPTAVRIGHDSGVYMGSAFALGPDAEVRIGDFSMLTGTTISSNGRVEIGDYVLVSYKVVIADSFAAVPPECPVTGNHGGSAGARSGVDSVPISIGDDAWVGARAVILPGAVVGQGAIVGFGTVVDFEVPPYAVVAGNPARVVGWAGPRTAS